MVEKVPEVEKLPEKVAEPVVEEIKAVVEEVEPVKEVEAVVEEAKAVVTELPPPPAEPVGKD